MCPVKPAGNGDRRRGSLVLDESGGSAGLARGSGVNYGGVKTVD